MLLLSILPLPGRLEASGVESVWGEVSQESPKNREKSESCRFTYGITALFMECEGTAAVPPTDIGHAATAPHMATRTVLNVPSVESIRASLNWRCFCDRPVTLGTYNYTHP